MSGLSTGVGLISGLETAKIVDALMGVQRRPVARLESRVKGFETRDAALQILQQQMLTIEGSVQQLGDSATFEAFKSVSSDEAHLRATARPGAVSDTYQFQVARTAAAHEVISTGFANADVQTLGAGTITVRQGGFLNRATALEVLNGGEGVRRGTIRITDRSGAAADIDLTNAFSVEDVLAAVNGNTSISVEATTRDGQIILTDRSGGAGTLSIADQGGGHAAEDLGIAGSAAASVLTGSTVFEISGDFTLDLLNDGNGPRLTGGTSADLRITLADATVLDVNLDGAASLDQVLARINDHTDNSGKVTASLVNGRIELQDMTAGAGTFAVEDVNGATAARSLGLDIAAAGGTISGRRLSAGINSVLLRNLRGGQGINTPGQITLADRTGTTATIDLTAAESLDEVIAAINAAESAGSVKLQLEATINADGTGIQIRDTSGATASNVIVADVGAGTLAADLGIAVNAAQDSVDSGALDLRFVNEATSLSKWSPRGTAVSSGSFRITDSAGNSATVSINSSVKNIGDVLQRINAAGGIAVRAELNDTGDGFVIVDEAGGAAALSVTEVGSGRTAADLRILGTGTDSGDGISRLSGRLATIVDIAADDTLSDVAAKINAAGGHVTASVIDDGSAFNSTRLILKSKASGTAGRLAIDDGNLNLGLSTRTAGRDALLWSGEPGTGFLLSSSTNTFKDAAPGVDVDAVSVGTETATVTVSRDTSKAKTAVKAFLSGYNSLLASIDELTKFDLDANQRGVLQGDSIAGRIRLRLESMANRRFFSDDAAVSSLVDLGIRFDEGGKLSLNEERLDEMLAEDPDAVGDFFLDGTSGFADAAEATFESFTDPFTGTFKTEEDAFKVSVESMNRRIDELDAILAVRRNRLLLEFAKLEESLGTLQSQQQALDGLNNIGK